MNIEQLKEEIKKTGMEDKYIQIGTTPYCEDCFNLLKRQDGKWEIFYGEKGRKVNVRIYDTEEEAADQFLKLIQQYAPRHVVFNSWFSCWKKKK